ncbi:NUDIX hydrolase [Nocardioides sp.]|uniref:NUDIX hydrolase n=1 Tax=Nocardioides sp. TaxID=35761 RepID=UPI0031FEBA73
MRTRCHYGGPVQRFASIIVVDARGWILLQERDEHPVIDPEKWGFVGGHVEDDEDVESAAYRELEEETGLHLDAGLARAGVFVVRHRDSDDPVELFVIRMDLTDGDIDCHEGRQIVFVDPSRARNELDLTASAALIVPRFLDSDLYRSMCP